MTSRWGLRTRAFAWALVGLLTVGVPGSGLSLAAEQGAALTVASDPVGAAVYVDGKLQGQTPLAMGSLSVGDHRVKVVKDGYLENSRLVTVRPGQAGSLNVHLTPGSSNLRMQVDDQPGTPAAPAAEAKKGGGGGKIALIALGAAAVGGGAFLLLKPKNKPPVAGTVTGAPLTALMAATEVTFTSQGASDPDGDPLTYTWDFGDGQTGTGSTVKHVYQTAGTFSVKCKVADKKVGVETTPISVVVTSVSGDWNGSYYTAKVNLNQSGTSVVGSYRDFYGTGTLSSGKITAPNRMDFVATQGSGSCTWTGTFSCTLNGTFNSCVGTMAERETCPGYLYTSTRAFTWSR